MTPLPRRPRRALPVSAALLLALLAAGPAAGLPVALRLDPGRSALVPEAGPPRPLAGALALEVGRLPVPTAGTAFDLAALELEAPGLRVGLDPAFDPAGAGLLRPDGSFLFPTLFLQVDGGEGPAPLALPDVRGTARLAPGGGAVERLEAELALETGGAAGLVKVRLVAVPEPGAAALLGAGALLLGAAARRLRRGRP